MRERRLRTSIILLLLTSMVVAFGSVGATILLLRLPQIEDENRAHAKRAVAELATRVELLLSAPEQQLRLIGKGLEVLSGGGIRPLVQEAIAGDNALQAVFVAKRDGTLIQASVAGVTADMQAELIGNDISTLPLFRKALLSDEPVVWSGKHLSALSGEVTIAIAVPLAGYVLIGEIPLTHVLHAVQVAGTHHQLPVWVVDNRGELVADTNLPDNVGLLNMSGIDPVDAALHGREIPASFTYEGRNFHPAVARSQALDWYLIVRVPAGWAHERIRVTTFLVIIAFAGATLMGLVLAPSWAERIERPVREMIVRARRTAEGETLPSWPQGNVTELNRLSADLEVMANTIQQRELMFRTIFDASPVPLSVVGLDPDLTVREVNRAWMKAFGNEQADGLADSRWMGNTWHSKDERRQATQVIREQPDRLPARLISANGDLRECLLSSRRIWVGDDDLLIVVTEDVTEQKRIDRELRELNAELEQRVTARTKELARLNEELSTTVEHLQRAQDELVRAEKLAALGKLVAGVAHELSTPLGNGLMSVSVIQDNLQFLREAAATGANGLPPESFVTKVTNAADIAVRNLRRAAELVSSFKQVAVDQTSSKRRSFDLQGLVEEILLTLQPTLKRHPVTVTSNIAPGMIFDSYPGALVQVMTNLISNALLHAFEGRDHGTIRIDAESVNQQQARLSVSDDGVGIPPGLIERIFDPFVTSRLGSGGTGLGLHITHNAVVNVMGGTIKVRSERGVGTRFEMTLPLRAPEVETPTDIAGAGTDANAM